MPDIQSICRQFAHILGGEPNIKNGVCMVERDRKHIHVHIMGRPSRSVLSSMWLFESLDPSGKSLNLGETAVLEEEVYPFTSQLQRNGLIVTAVHNHWLFEQPRLIYVHYSSIEEPLSFARKSAAAYALLK